MSETEAHHTDARDAWAVLLLGRLQEVHGAIPAAARGRYQFELPATAGAGASAFLSVDVGPALTWTVGVEPDAHAWITVSEASCAAMVAGRAADALDVTGDQARATRLFEALSRDGLSPWMTRVSR
jgi:hypothetical protein